MVRVKEDLVKSALEAYLDWDARIVLLLQRELLSGKSRRLTE